MNPKKVLIVDDDQVILDTLARLVESLGYEALTAQDGSQAVSIARQQVPELILLDLLYPPDVAHGGGVAWDGFLIIDWLRRMDEVKSTPIFVITQGEAEKYRNSAFAKGAAAFFQKPVNTDELGALVRKTLGEASFETDTSIRVKLGR